jgi:hypothetical protein
MVQRQFNLRWKNCDIFKAMIEEMGEIEARRRRYI